MYPPAFLTYYRTHVTCSESDPEELHRRHGVRTVVVDLPSGATAALLGKLAASDKWALVFLDRAGAVFARVDDTTAALVEQHRVNLDKRVDELVNDDHSDPAVPAWLGGKRLAYPSANLVVFLTVVGRPDLALNEANRLWPQTRTEELGIMAGQAAFRSGRIAAQLPRLEEALALYPASSRIANLTALALGARADDLLNEGAFEEAERHLRRMVGLMPNACGPYTGLAKAAALRGDAAMARQLLAQAATKDGGAACQRSAEADPLLGRLFR